ncbi:MAG: ParB/RepB/Spo0J family partition protein [Clostridia bacterium]|nr:ParB/RepB/Spo0J family partition protein [Clostridia bacterium]
MKKPKSEKIHYINPKCIFDNPYQPRQIIDKDKMDGLIKSIKKNGIIQPIVVRELSKSKYELICGNRRLKAAVFLKMQTVPCILQSVNDKTMFAFSLIENIQRDNLNFIEEAVAIERLIKEYNYTQMQVADKLGLSQSTIANKLRILKLDNRQLEKILKFSLTERHARALLKVTDPNLQSDVLNEVIIKQLNVEQTEKLVETTLTPKKTREEKMVVKDVRLFVNSINKAIKVMKNSGISAKSHREEDENCIKYTVIIPK